MAFNQSSRDGKKLTGYQLLALGQVATNFKSGIVPKAGSEFLVSYSGLNFTIGSGVLIDSGLIVENDSQVSGITLNTNGVNGTQYLVIENNRNTGVSTPKFVSSLIETNLVQNPQGTTHFLLATVNHSSSGITGLQQNNMNFEKDNVAVLIYSGNASEGATINLLEDPNNFNTIYIEYASMEDGSSAVMPPHKSSNVINAFLYKAVAAGHQSITTRLTKVSDLNWKIVTSNLIAHNASANHSSSSTGYTVVKSIYGIGRKRLAV